MKETAVLLLNWNGRALLEKYLPSVAAYSPTRLADVWVIDNGSEDGSPEYVEANFPTVKLMRFQENLGFAGGYNKAVGALADTYKYSLLLNTDVRVEEGWLQPLVAFMKAHPKAGAIQPKIMSDSEPEKFEYAGAMGGFLDKNGYPYCRGRIFSTVETDSGQYDTPMQVDWASGAALLVDNELFLAVGGFDKAFFAHMEEIDLCWRMRLAGRQVWAVPDSRVFHLGGGSLPASNSRKTYLNFRNNLLMLYKNLPSEVSGGRIMRRKLLDGLAAMMFLAKGELKHFKAVVKAHRDFEKMKGHLTRSCPEADMLEVRPNILTNYYLSGHKTFSSVK